MTSDMINATFEGLGALFVWNNVRVLWRDRCVRGVSWTTQAFYGVWGLWNFFWYASLGQYYSFWVGAVLTSGSLSWTWLALIVRWQERTVTRKLRLVR